VLSAPNTVRAAVGSQKSDAAPAVALILDQRSHGPSELLGKMAKLPNDGKHSTCAEAVAID
jgi:hypothetical protein